MVELWKIALPTRFLTLAEYFEAVQSFAGMNAEMEIAIRTSCYHESNQQILDGYELAADRVQIKFYNDNIRRLYELLDPYDAGQFMKIAEIQRNLGEFDNCLELPDQIADKILDYG